MIVFAVWVNYKKSNTDLREFLKKTGRNTEKASSEGSVSIFLPIIAHNAEECKRCEANHAARRGYNRA